MWERLRKISKTVFRVLTACFMAVVVAGALYWAWITFEDQRLERIVSQARNWKARTVPLSVPTIAKLKTRCKNTRLSYQLDIEPKEKVKATDKRATFKKAVEEIDEFRIHFMDRDRFTLITVTVKVGDLRRVIDDDREVLGYRANSSDYCVEVLPSGSSTV